MATHSSILAWRIPWTEELCGLQSTGCKESDTAKRLHFTSLHFRVFKTNYWHFSPICIFKICMSSWVSTISLIYLIKINGNALILSILTFFILRLSQLYPQLFLQLVSIQSKVIHCTWLYHSLKFLLILNSLCLYFPCPWLRKSAWF